MNQDCKRSGDPPLRRHSMAGIFGAILMGAGSGSEADVIPYMIAGYFGRKRSATLYGLSWTAYAIGGALGPILIGHGFDRAGPRPRYQ